MPDPVLLKLKPVVLVILDGWGIAPPGPGNAIVQAKTPRLSKLMGTFPALSVLAAGESVGLTWGELGNSQVGHLNIGAGHIIYQSLPRINMAIASGAFRQNSTLLKTMEYVRQSKRRLHLVGLLGSGNVHASGEHLYALLALAKEQGLKEVFIHAILDGRDTPHNSVPLFLRELQAKIDILGVGRVATLAGRFYAMDRDNHWDRIGRAYRAMVFGEADQRGDDPLALVERSYQRQVFDEQFEPAVITAAGEPVGLVRDGDAVIFWNFRADRARQLTKAFTLPGLEKFERGDYLRTLRFVTMTEYEQHLPVEVVFPQELIQYPLSRVVAEAGLKQFHIAETEKYAHVTFFLNGGREEPFDGEDRALIPSPSVASYDQKPEMAAREITDRVLREVSRGYYDFIVVNYANADMVAHTGDLAATVRAVELLDELVGQVVDTALSVGGAVVITADHGNAEGLLNLQTGEIDKEHSNAPVPLIIVGKPWEGKTLLPGGLTDLSTAPAASVLADVAPTVLKIMGLKQPEEMTGSPLI